MDPTVPYFACVAGAAAIYVLLLPRKQGAKSLGMKVAGSLIGLGVFAWLVVEVAKILPVGAGGGPGAPSPEPFFMIFSLIAIASAVRMITHPKPVYSALYFIMVVLSSAALFLLLDAEFMAFALVIVYAGAILITYMFVLMLAQQAPDADDPNAQPDYDRVPREPAAAAVVGFIMLALFSHMIFDGTSQLPRPPSVEQAQARMWGQLNLMPGDLAAIVKDRAPGSILDSDSGKPVKTDGDNAYVLASKPGETSKTRIDLPETSLPNNVQLVGLDLVHKFPVSLELAGIILLMAMFGAVVLARKQIELGEDEVREAAGMRRLAFHSDEHTDHSRSSDLGEAD